MTKPIEQQKIEFDMKISFWYGLLTGLFIGLSMAFLVWRAYG